MQPRSTARTVLVTGGGRGIGRAVALAFAERGDRVAVTVRGEPRPGADPVLEVVCDVARPETIDPAFAAVEAEFGPVEVLVSNAGVTRDALLLRMREDDLATVLETNLAGALRVAKRACGPMLRARSGRMIFLSSVVGLTGSPGQASYAASKAGLIGAARSLARELAGRGITANVVAPGPIDTDMTRALPDEVRADILARVPIARFGLAEEVAAAVLFLADAAYITGAVLPVDGGMGMGH